jgi:hypothetical protein
MIRASLVLLPVLLVGLFAPSRAAAQKRSRTVTVPEMQIVGHIQRPIAAVDVSRVQAKLTLAELRQPFLDRIEKPLYDGTL